MVDELRPVIIGVGEASERMRAPDYAALSPVELAAAACREALADACATGASSAVDLIAAIRQFEVSGPQAVAPFGKADNFPRAVARRIGANPARAILEPVGGQGPQHLVNEMCHVVANGEAELALICGSEAISTVRHLTEQGETRQWGEIVGGQLEDRGYGVQGLLTRDLASHGARTPMLVYALFENARRRKTLLDRRAYQLEMGRLFAPFTKVAARNPHAMSHEVFSPEELAEVTERNRLVADPYPRRMVARDQANQGAAVLIASVKKARELRVPEERWVYLHGGADVKERSPMERRDLSAYPAAGLASRRALELAGLSAAEVGMFDLYSCFPVAVFDLCDELGLSLDDPRPLTVTGGLPFFGGAGNNYSMHAIAEMTRRLRAEPGAFGFVGANGGYFSKYSVGIYSTRPAPWRPFDSADLQAEIDAWPSPDSAPEDAMFGEVETYTIDYQGRAPTGIVIGRTREGARFTAMTEPGDAIARRMIEEDPLGAAITCRLDDKGRRVLERFARGPV